MSLDTIAPANAPASATAPLHPRYLDLLRGSFGQPLGAPTAPVAAPARPQVLTYDASAGPDQPQLVRGAGDGPVADAIVNSAHDNAGIVLDFFQQVLGRDSIDGKGSPVKAVVQYGTTADQVLNAVWNGDQLLLGKGFPGVMKPLGTALDVVAHEMMHGVTQHTAGLVYEGQSGALNESFSDVVAAAVEQWHAAPATFDSPAAAQQADWLIGNDIVEHDIASAMRNMQSPNDPTVFLGMRQPDSMQGYDDSSEEAAADHGGVHLKSGIPNRAAYEAAVRIGTDKVVKIWYDALQHGMAPNTNFDQAARATVNSAVNLYGGGAVPAAVKQAWQAVGLLKPHWWQL
jgi:Zn-dependent metalloprotease